MNTKSKDQKFTRLKKVLEFADKAIKSSKNCTAYYLRDGITNENYETIIIQATQYLQKANHLLLGIK
jgi:hypothetical protein